MLFLLLLIPFVSASADYDVQIVTQYLQTYGYLTHDNKTVSSIGVGGNSSSFQEALIKFQDFFRIEATGELDNETITIMKKPRCGVKDYPQSFTLYDTKWKKNKLGWKFVYGNQQDKSIAEKCFAEWARHTNMTFLWMKGSLILL
ncbi:hypothetical protein HHI36_022152 [Cryptolaemus montrouzieri]|uniref:Peptidoglycan binding-like domain-containing protein n=1 Tax=Cryptolaemus montrouzieri TaxID=559131 RepID=A0ABD2MZ52_9CUCU